MATYVLTSMYEKEFPSETIKMLKSEIKGRHSIVCIASDFYSYKMTDHFWSIFYDMFCNAGLEFESSMVIDSRMTPEMAREYTKNADVVWISGGDTPTEYKYIKEYGLDDILKEYDGVVIGMSAGTLNLAQTVICAICNGHYEQVIYDGLGLVDITVISHYDMKEVQQEILDLSMKYEIYLMTDGSHILCNENGKRYYGDIICLNKGEIKTISNL